MRRDLVDGVGLGMATAYVVIVKVASCKVGGVYGKCGIGVYDLKDWLVTMTGWIGGGERVLLGDWNANDNLWSLDGRLVPGRRVIAQWTQEHGVEVQFGGGGTIEPRHVGDVVQSRIDVTVSSPECDWTGEDDDWLLSGHACIGGSLVVGELEGSMSGK